MKSVKDRLEQIGAKKLDEKYNEQEGLQTLRNEVVSLLRTLTYKQLLEIKNTYENKAIKEN